MIGLVFGAAACSPRPPTVEWSGDAAVVVRVGSNGEDRGGLVLAPGATASVEPRDDELVVVYQIPADRALGLDGQRLSPSVLESLEVELSSGGAGTCAGCRVPGSLSLRLGPGDACLLPAPIATAGRVYRLVGGEVVEVEDPLLIEDLAFRVRLVRPGECPPGPISFVSDRGGIEVCATDGWLPETVSVGPGGSIAAAGGGHAALVTPEGTTVEWKLESPGRLGEILPPLAAGGPFLLADGSLRALNSNGTIARIPTPGVQARGLAVLQLGSVHVFGSGPDGEPAISRCRVQNGGKVSRCVRETLACEGAEGLVDGFFTTGGSYAVGIDGSLFTPDSDQVWRCPDRIRTNGEDGFRPVRIEEAVTDGERLWMCADGFLNGRAGAVGVLSWDEENGVNVVDATPDGLVCGALRPFPPDRLLTLRGYVGGGLVQTDSGDVLPCEANLDCVPSLPAVFPAAAVHGIADVAFGLGGHVAVLDRSGRAFVLDPGAAEPRRVLGEASLPPYGSVALAERDGVLWSVFGADAPERLEGGETGCGSYRWTRAQPADWTLIEDEDERRVGQVFPGQWSDRITAAAVIHNDPVLLASGRDLGADVPWLRSIDVERGRVEAIALRGPSEPASLARIGSGALLVFADRLSYLDAEGRIQELTVIWDEPTTPVIEGGRIGDGAWRAAVPAHPGVVWVVGWNRLARVLAQPSGPPEVEGWWSFGAEQGADVWSGTAIDPSFIMVGERVYGADGRARIRFSGRGPRCRLGAFCDRFEVSPEDLTERRPEVPGPLVPLAGGLTTISLIEGWLARGSSGVPLPMPWVTGAAATPHELVVSGVGRRAVARIER